MKLKMLTTLVASALIVSALPVLTGAETSAAAASGLTEKTAQVGDQRVHYLQAGSGPITIVLLHGWPQSSHEWRRVIPLLADRYTVVTPDLRGIGGTSAPSEDFAKTTLARDVHGLVATLGKGRVIVAGHDIGGMVAYAYARLYPDELLGIAILDVPLPGVPPWDTIRSSSHAWHFNFHGQKPLAEQLVQGRQATYFRYIINSNAAKPSAITDEDVAAYAAAYGSPESLRAGFEFYRAFPADEKFNASHREPLDVPVLLAGGDHSLGAAEAELERGLKALGIGHTHVEVIPNSGHWIAEENPAATAQAIATFAEGLR